MIYISKNILKIENLITPNVQPSISIISHIEVLGFPFATNEDQLYMQKICSLCKLMYLSDLLVSETIKLRKEYRIKLPDAIIYASALVENLPLVTNNIADFKSLNRNVELINPFDL
ncbi:MAG TPA: type II toxin-antitoxin system VapC family toxin [Mucilaginibacter sp.]